MAWLRNLIQEGLIADGEVDSRSIAEITPNDVHGFTQCHFFAGLGGWSGALRLAGWPDHRAVWTGSCPCQPFSLAGKQGGFADERHLWPYWHYLVQVCRPAKVYGEQVASASAWLGLVRGDLEAMGYAVGAIPVEAASAGADHLRDRYWFVANGSSKGRWQDTGSASAHEGEYAWRPANSNHVPTGDVQGAVGHSSSTRLAVGSLAAEQRGLVRQERQASAAPSDRGDAMANAERQRREMAVQHASSSGTSPEEWQADVPGGNVPSYEWVIGADGKQRRVKPGIRLLANGVPARVAKLRALGNAIDLRPAAAFIRATM